jgi:mannose/cellobiose epimerase-like protein (N-acyl-D-glucosamine 2-epimerase family)
MACRYLSLLNGLPMLFNINTVHFKPIYMFTSKFFKTALLPAVCFLSVCLLSVNSDELLKPWYPKAIDTAYGGFLSSFSYDFKPVGNQDKMIVTQARHVWSNAKAAQLFPDVKYYAEGARQGYLFLKNVLWDKQYGGFYTYTDRQGNVKKSSFAPKEAYGNSFALYAMAAYYQQSGDTSALNLAKRNLCGWNSIATTLLIKAITNIWSAMAHL